MKHKLKILTCLTLLLCFCSFQGISTAQADPESLTIQSIAILKEADAFILNIAFENNSSRYIDEFGIAIAFFDKEGARVFGYPDSLAGYTEEICNWYYTPDDAIAPGARYLTEDIFAGYAHADNLGIAIRYYHNAEEDYVLLPESQWQWVFPGYETAIASQNRDFYASPPDALYTLIADFDLGYTYYLLDDFNASYYGKNQGGEWITHVKADSPAGNAGFLDGDLVLFADGRKPTENLYAVEYALAAVLSGETVDFVVEREGLITVIRIAAP